MNLLATPLYRLLKPKRNRFEPPLVFTDDSDSAAPAPALLAGRSSSIVPPPHAAVAGASPLDATTHSICAGSNE